MGHDEVKSVSGQPHDWGKTGLAITPIDALDGLILLGLTETADSVREYIATEVSWDKDVFISVFEINIRCLGGLLSAYELTGDKRLLEKATDLADRLLPAFKTPTGMPYRFVNLKTGKTGGAISNPAEIGTLLLEFGTLSRHTGNRTYYDKAYKALGELYKRRSDIGLVADAINVETGEWKGATCHVGACIDSYFEYLLKGWLLFGDTGLKEMWDTYHASLRKYCEKETVNGFWYGRADMHGGEMVSPQYGALEAFFPTLLLMSGDTLPAAKLHETWFRIWNIHDLEPETFDFEAMEIPKGGLSYVLRPEIIESTYYLYTATGDARYLAMGGKIFGDLMKHCRTDIGFTEITNIITKEKGDLMHSFLFGETLKYLYLLFAPASPLDLTKVVLTTEAHPLKK